jgi:hypothetical protein
MCNGCRQGDDTWERFVAKSVMKRYFTAKPPSSPSQTDGNHNVEVRKRISGISSQGGPWRTWRLGGSNFFPFCRPAHVTFTHVGTLRVLCEGSLTFCWENSGSRLKGPTANPSDSHRPPKWPWWTGIEEKCLSRLHLQWFYNRWHLHSKYNL